MPDSYLIQQVELLDQNFASRAADVRLTNGIVAEIGRLTARTDETVVAGKGGALLPGLQDHHIHVAASAAAMQSVRCGPPDVETEAGLVASLQDARPAQTDGWVRGVGYHDSVAGEIDRHWLDANGPACPVRIQHRSGQLWILNTAALEFIKERASGEELEEPLPADGRLYHRDELIATYTPKPPLPIREFSHKLASFGVTGVNDMTVTNNVKRWHWFHSQLAQGALQQKVRVTGDLSLNGLVPASDRVMLGEFKLYLHDHNLPDFAGAVCEVQTCHDAGRSVAVHCVTEAELVFALAVLREAGTRAGDRIEHASIVPPDLIEQLQELKVWVVTQPNFVRERGDRYLKEVEAEHLGSLYRIRSLSDVDIPLAFGTDAPFGDPDPWAAMQAAVDRKTGRGELIGRDEAVTPEQALAGFLGSLDEPTTPRLIAEGEPADCLLLTIPWREQREKFSSQHVRAVWLDGSVIYSTEDLPGARSAPAQAD